MRQCYIGTRTQHSLDSLCPFLYELQNLVKLCGEEIESRQYASVRAEVVPSYTGVK